MNHTERFRIDTRIPFDHHALMEALRRLDERYSFFEFSYLSTSMLDREIPLIKLGHGARGVLYVGAHHGMEWITAALLTVFAHDLCEGLECNRRIGGLAIDLIFKTHTLYIVPMLNPDGVEYQIHGICEDNPLFERLLSMNGGSVDFSRWQANARGVDLNHNYDAGFSEYKKIEEESKIPEGAPTKYSGVAPESEVEVRALCDFIRFHDTLRGVMTLHTQGEEIFYRTENIALPHTDAIAARLSRLCGYRRSIAEGASAYGGLTDWCVQKRNLPSFTVECGKGINPLPFSNLYSIYSTIRQMLFFFPTLL